MAARITDNIIMPRHRLTELESKLIFYFIGQIKTAGRGVVKYRLAAKKLLQLAGLTQDKRPYLAEIMTVLFRKSVQINRPTGWTKYHWFDTLEWNHKDDAFIVHTNSGLKPYLLQLSQNLTLPQFKRLNAKDSFNG